MHALGSLRHHLGRHVAAEIDFDYDVGIEVVTVFNHRLAYYAGLPTGI
jgi:hypothetical protein